MPFHIRTGKRLAATATEIVVRLRPMPRTPVERTRDAGYVRLRGTPTASIGVATTRNIVWRAMASKDLDPNAKPEKRNKNINSAAERLFKNYPPKS